MSDMTKVLIGLGVFVLLLGYPFLNNLGQTYVPPDLAKPTKAKECVEDTEWMRANHMALLNDWRHQVVRNGKQLYVSSATGKEYEMSLQETCMDCHTSKAQFCDKCHNDNSVQPYCWTCHISPDATQGEAAPSMTAETEKEKDHE